MNTLIKSTILTSFVSCFVYPPIHIEVMKYLDKNDLTIVMFLSYLISWLVSDVWLRFSDVLYKHKKIFLIIDISFSLFLSLMIFILNDYYSYYMLQNIIGTLFGMNTLKILVRYKSEHFQDKKRETLDNKTSKYSSIACIVGCVCSFFVTLPIQVYVLLSCLSWITEDVMYLSLLSKKNKQTF